MVIPVVVVFRKDEAGWEGDRPVEGLVGGAPIGGRIEEVEFVVERGREGR